VRRRAFITLLGGAAAGWPLAARAQRSAKLPTIGFLGGDATAWAPWTAAFVARLRELGWIEGRTIAIEHRWSEGRPERIAEIAAEFVRLKVDVIVTNDSAAPTLKQATSAIPIAFVLGYDPVAIGLVASLARPGGNITGLSNNLPISPASGSKFYARFSPASGAWQLWATSAIPACCWKSARLKRQLAHWEWKSRPSQFGARRTLHQLLRRSRDRRMRFTS
jgi:ABC transporter substrate binding protein